MRTQFIVLEHDIKKRKEFYKYIHANFDLEDYLNENEILDKVFPFVVDFKEKALWVCNSITCCVCAVQNKQIITVEEFKKEMRK